MILFAARLRFGWSRQGTSKKSKESMGPTQWNIFKKSLMSVLGTQEDISHSLFAMRLVQRDWVLSRSDGSTSRPNPNPALWSIARPAAPMERLYWGWEEALWDGRGLGSQYQCGPRQLPPTPTPWPRGLNVFGNYGKEQRRTLTTNPNPTIFL